MKKRLFTGLFLLLSLAGVQTQATHIMGGELTYEFAYEDPEYHLYYFYVYITVYRYCDTTNGPTAPLQNQIQLQVFKPKYLGQADTIPFYQQYEFSLMELNYIDPPGMGATCSFANNVCVERGVYYDMIVVDSSSTGYYLAAWTGARNGTIANLINPLQTQVVFFAQMPPTDLKNSSPYFSDYPVPYLCVNDTVNLLNTAFDNDGDLLQYAFTIPYDSLNIDPTLPSFDSIPLVFPIVPVQYAPGYSFSAPFGNSGYAHINSATGLTKYKIPNQGFFVVAVEISELRNGNVISRIRRDFQLIAIPCLPNSAPLSSTSNQLNFTITEGDTLCFPLTFTDPDNDSLFLSASGPVFNSSLFASPATMPDAEGEGSVTGQFCWITECGYARPVPFQFVVNVSDNGCPSKEVNAVVSILVNPRTDYLPAPTVQVYPIPQDPFCEGTSVTFFCQFTNGGAAPRFEWLINDAATGNHNIFFTTNTLKDMDSVKLIVTSSLLCIDSTRGSGQYVVHLFKNPHADFYFTPLHADVFYPEIHFQNVSQNAILYEWNFNDSTFSQSENPVHLFPDAGIYNVQLFAVSTHGCRDSIVRKVEVVDVPLWYVPNAFTPNNDGKNDRFLPGIRGMQFVEIAIYNRWGQQVFFSDSMNHTWDGNYKNEAQPSGIYALVMKMTDFNGEQHEYKGSIMLIR